MAGSHEVRGSIPLGSTTDPRGARRRRRAPLFFASRAHRTERAYRTKSVSHSGASARAGAPFSFARTRRPHSSARAESAPPPRMGIARPGRSRAPAPRARRPRRTRPGASRRSATGRGRVRRVAASAPPSSMGPIGPREAAARRRREGRRRNRGRFGFGGGGLANPDIGGLPEALDVRRPLSRGGGPRGDAAIEPANRTPKKGPIYRRASAGLGRLRREPDPCVRRRSGAMAHSALGCMGPAGFGNAGSSP